MTERSQTMGTRFETLSADKAKLLELLVEQRSRRRQEIEPYPRNVDACGIARLRTSWSQQRLWFIDQLEGGSAAYNVPLTLRLQGFLDIDALQTALDTLVSRHEVLRTTFTEVAGDSMQQIRAGGCFALMTVHLNHTGGDLSARVRRHQEEEATTPFDLRSGPLIRGRLLQLQEDEHVLLITSHHIVSDGWSLGVMLREIAELYSARREFRSHALPPLPIQYADYAQWQRQRFVGEVLDQQLAYWQSQLEDALPELELPTDRQRPSVARYQGRTLPVELDATLTSALNGFSRRHGMTLFMVLYAAWAILLSRLSGQSDVVIGTPVANRRRPEVEALIGFFVNTLALRIEVMRDMSLSEFLERVKTVTLGAYDHQDMPFERLVEALRPERSLSRHPIFQVMLVLQNSPHSEVQFSGLDLTIEDEVIRTSKFDLLLALGERNGMIRGVVNYDTDLLDEQTVNRWIASYTVLLKGMVSGVHGKLAELPLLTARERNEVIARFNDTRASYRRETLIHELFERQVACSPELMAITHGRRSITYAELNAKANQLARRLKGKGIGRDNVVGICADRSIEMIVGLLGILKAGAPYLPLDPNYPPERLDYMLQDAGPSVVLTRSAWRSMLTTGAELIELDFALEKLAGTDASHLAEAEERAKPSDLVYVIYTSGSTGRPKGTAMPHEAMVNLLEWHRETLPLQAGERVLQFAALSFDVAFQEIFSTLCGGGTLVLLDEWVRRDARALGELLSNESVQRLFLPPLMLQTLAEYFKAKNTAPQSLKDIITAGEQLRISPEVVDLFEHLGKCRLHNHYGPTETHVVTALTLEGTPKTWPTLPTIGKPIANTQIYILDADRQPVPIGVTGEIYIAGANVARGYLNRPELTKERFVLDPFNADPHARMYRVGDIGRWRVDGTVEYLGRNDDQVKIRGFRIELGEIEAQLTRHAAVKEAAVVARDEGSGAKRLVAYVTLRDRRELSVEELGAQLKSSLPEHMVPSAFVVLGSLPLTPSGKLNRRALPAPDQDAYPRQQYERPVGDAEVKLAEIWQRLLGAQGIGRDDNFFDLGGHSLLVLKALFEIEKSCGVTLKVTDVYKCPSVRTLAACIGSAATEDTCVDLEREAALPEQIVAPAGSPRQPAKAVLLTGGTGFVGRFLLAQLLEDADATIYCLVRADSECQANLRLRTTLGMWDLWRDEFESRLVAIPGDLRLPRLGIDAVSYRAVCRNVDAIYHCGTSMNHLETYAMAKPANVDAARELLKIAAYDKPKLLNFISTLGIFNPLASDAPRLVHEESTIDAEEHLHSSGYLASKWVGEKIFMAANARGIPCNIFRLGLVWADAQLGRYDELQRVYRIVKSCLLSGYGIENYQRYEMPPIPVDSVVRAIVYLAERHNRGQGVFHISGSRRTEAGLFELLNEIAGTHLELVPFYDWIRKMKRLHQAGRSLPAVPLIEYAFSMDEESFYEQHRRFHEHVRVDCDRTRIELERGKIVAPVIDGKLLGLCLESMLSRDAELREWAVADDGAMAHACNRGRGMQSVGVT